MRRVITIGLMLCLASITALAGKPADLGQEHGKRAERQTGHEVSAPAARTEQEAFDALRETQVVLAALDKGDKQTALDAPAKATDKLELLDSRYPELGFIPLDIAIGEVDLVATEKALKKATTTAQSGQSTHNDNKE